MEALQKILTGLTDAHVEASEAGVLIHREMKPAFVLLKQAAADAGFELAIASGFRNFEAQLRIWNLKCQGKRDLLDSNGVKLDYSSLTDEQIIYSILRWSALPGASRHHWGTDIDVFDENVTKHGHKLLLTPQEAAPGGPFADFSAWLEDNMEEQGFFRPYARDLGGVSPEWWHLSYAPVAQKYYESHSLELLRTAIQQAEMEKKDRILALLPALYKKYVQNISLP